MLFDEWNEPEVLVKPRTTLAEMYAGWALKDPSWWLKVEEANARVVLVPVRAPSLVAGIVKVIAMAGVAAWFLVAIA